MNSCSCLCQKYHNDILNMLPSFDLITTAAIQPDKNQNSSLRNLQNACAKENKSLKITEMYTFVYVQLWHIIKNYCVRTIQSENRCSLQERLVNLVALS